MRASIVRPIAEQALEALRPHCARIEIAGSLRRGAADVKDIEIVCIPRTAALFGFAAVVNRWQKVKGEPTGKYTQRVVDAGLKLDLFMCTPSTWGCILFIRTGCADFSKAVVTYAHGKGMRFDEGQLWLAADRDYAKKLLPVAEEADVFRLLGLPWIEPSERTGRLQEILGAARP